MEDRTLLSLAVPKLVVMPVAVTPDHVTQARASFLSCQIYCPMLHTIVSWNTRLLRAPGYARLFLASVLQPLLPICLENSCPTFSPWTATHASGSFRHGLSSALSSVTFSSVPTAVFVLSAPFVRICLCFGCCAISSTELGVLLMKEVMRVSCVHPCKSALPGTLCKHTAPYFPCHGLCEPHHVMPCCAPTAQSRWWPWAPVVFNCMYICLFYMTENALRACSLSLQRVNTHYPPPNA